MGDTGAGKSNAIRQILQQVQERGEAAIVYDPACEFVQEFLGENYVRPPALEHVDLRPLN